MKILVFFVIFFYLEANMEFFIILLVTLVSNVPVVHSICHVGKVLLVKQW